MICISVTPTSRKLAKVDILNACRSADMVEFCMDHLSKEPDMGDILSAATKPVLVSCRRAEDGGHWNGSEERRQNMLRQSIIAEPDYVELELDIARSIPRFGKTKRVISYSSLDRPLKKVDDIIAEALLANADVLKFTWPTPDLDSAWPLLAASTSKQELPIVGQALGDGGITFSLLAHKFGSPWIYAALEKGMEAHPGQRTIWELRESFDLDAIDAKTRLVGIVGPSAATDRVARDLNTAMKTAGVNVRCLPFDFQSLDKLEKRLDVLKIRALIVSPGSAEKIRPLAKTSEPAVEATGCLDLLLHQAEGWQGYNLFWRSVVTAIETQLRGEDTSDRPLDGRGVLVLGSNELARTIAYGTVKRNALVTISSPIEEEARSLAEQLETRQQPLYNLYDMRPDVVILTDEKLQLGHRKSELNPAFLKPNMLVADVSGYGAESVFLDEARERDCRIVEPGEIFQSQRAAVFRSITGKEIPADAESNK